LVRGRTTGELESSSHKKGGKKGTSNSMGPWGRAGRFLPDGPVP